MPDRKQIAAIEAKACQFADALLSEGYALSAPDKREATKLLTYIAATKVLARIAREQNILPSTVISGALKNFERALAMAVQAELAQAQRLAAMMAQEKAPN